MINLFIVAFGKLLSSLSRFLNLGHGSTWPGHIALSINPHFISDILKNSNVKTVVIAGTNGKTTTGKLIKSILEHEGKKVFQNESGANLLNGIASSMLLRSNILCNIPYDYAVFEVDENTLPLAIDQFTPDYVVLLNLFRDQLDRYGEVDTIASKWKKSLSKLPKETTVILNADDPTIAFLGKGLKTKTFYFGLNDKTLMQAKRQHAADSTYCPKCETKLFYKYAYFSHLGDWECKQCKLKRPEINDLKIQTYPLSGIYNRYNTNVAVLFARINKINNEIIEQSLKDFKPAFGRQEVLTIDEKKVQIFLSKNPTSLNESIRTVKELNAKNVLLVLNDRIPDGRDVSWIWDVDTEELIEDDMNIMISGDRAYDMGLRIKYAVQSAKCKVQNYNEKVKIYENLKEAIRVGLKATKQNETLYILPTYSAMLEVRKILTGKRIL